MPRFFWFRLRLLIEMGGLGLFFYGFFTHNRLLTDIGGGILIGFDLLSMWAGLLNPLFPVVATIVVAGFFDPWRDGAYWVSAVFACIDVPFYLVWLVQPPMQVRHASPPEVPSASQASLPSSIAHFTLVEPPLRRKRVWPYILTVMVLGGIAIAVIVMSGKEFPDIFPIGRGPLADETSQGDPIAGSSPSPPRGTSQNDLSIWTRSSFADNTVAFDYPSDGFIDINQPGNVSVSTVVDGFTLLWGENVTGNDFNNIIATRDTDPNFAERYKDFVNHYMSEELESKGGKIISLGNLDILRISDHQVLMLDVVFTAPQETGTKLFHMLLYNFDCAGFACQAQYYKVGDEPFTPTERNRAEHMLGSITFAD